MRFLISFGIYFFSNAAFGIDSLTEGFQLPANGKVSVQGHGTCRTFTNANASKSFFIPTKTSSEYTTFINNIPANVTYATCKSCNEIKTNNGAANGSGLYDIDPDGAAGIAGFQVYCDMTTDGGGWTVFYGTNGSDGTYPLVSDTELTSNNPLSFGSYNLNRAKKMAISAISTQSIIVRNNSTWLKWSSAFFDSNLSTASQHAHYSVTITANNGTTASGYAGWTNYNLSGGGDYGVTTTNFANGFDHHSTTYFHLNSGCNYHYFYSYSAVTTDSDAAYNVNTGLGTWAATASCTSTEGSGIVFYGAMK